MKQKLFKWFPGLFTIQTNVTVKRIDTQDWGDKSPLRVYEVEKETTRLSEGLGTSDERFDALGREVNIAFAKHSNIIEVMEDVSKHATHANELFMLSYMVCQKMNSMNENPLAGIIAEALRKGKNPGGSNPPN